MSNTEKKYNYKHLSIDDIIEYCQENNEVEWLKEIAKSEVDTKVYPKKKVTRVNEDGEEYKTRIADKSKPYTIEKKPITFIQIKMAFCEKFMPDILPEKKEKEPTVTMYDRIANL